MCGEPTEVVVVSAPPPPPPVRHRCRLRRHRSRRRGWRRPRRRPSRSAGRSSTAPRRRRVNPVAGATVQFRLFAPGDVACTGTPVLTSTVPVDAAGRATSASFTTDRGGHLPLARVLQRGREQRRGQRRLQRPRRDRGRDLGDRAGDPQRDVRVAAGGRPLGDPRGARVGTGSQISGLQVAFDEARDKVALSACRVAVLGVLTGTREIRLAYVFRRSGAHVVSIVTLAGDCTGALKRAETTIGVNVAPATTARRAVRRAAARFVRGARSRRHRELQGPLPDPDRRPTSRGSPPRRCASSTPSAASAGASSSCASPRLALASLARTPSDMSGAGTSSTSARRAARSSLTRLRRAGYRGPTYAENIGYGSTNTPVAAGEGVDEQPRPPLEHPAPAAALRGRRLGHRLSRSLRSGPARCTRWTSARRCVSGP